MRTYCAECGAITECADLRVRAERAEAQRDAARRQRDALLAALEKAAIYTETKVEDLPPHLCCNFCLAPLEPHPGWDPCNCDDGKEARGAIAAAKKGGG